MTTGPRHLRPTRAESAARWLYRAITATMTRCLTTVAAVACVSLVIGAALASMF